MIRSASRSLFRAALPKPIPVALRSRSLHVSSTCLANEVPVDPFADSDPKIQAFREKVGQSPAVMEAIANVGRVMESKGKCCSACKSLLGKMSRVEMSCHWDCVDSHQVSIGQTHQAC